MINNKQKIIIFEGADKSAKSTIAQELSNMINVPYFKFKVWDYFKDNKFKNATYFDQPYILEFLKQTGYSVIIDRGYPSEYVYAQVFDRDFDRNFLEKLDIEFSKLNTTIIICFKKNNKEKDEIIPQDKYEKIIEKYLDFSLKTRCKVIILDTSSMDIKTQLLFLMGHLYNKEE